MLAFIQCEPVSNFLFTQDDVLIEQSDLGENERQRHGKEEEGNEEEGREEEQVREVEDNEKEQRDVGQQEESDFVASPLRSGGVDGERGTEVRSKCDY